MSQHTQNICCSAIKVHGGNQSILVPCNIENDHGSSAGAPYEVGMGEGLPHIMQTLPFGLRCNVIPALERLLGIGVALPELSKSFLANDVHDEYIMYSSGCCGQGATGKAISTRPEAEVRFGPCTRKRHKCTDQNRSPTVANTVRGSPKKKNCDPACDVATYRWSSRLRMLRARLTFFAPSQFPWRRS